MKQKLFRNFRPLQTLARINCLKSILAGFCIAFLCSACSSHKTLDTKESAPLAQLATPNLVLKPLSDETFYRVDPELHNLQLVIPDGSTVNIYYQADKRYNLAVNIANMIREFNKDFTKLLTASHPFVTNVILIDKDLFYVKTTSPSWVQALFHKDRIYIPLEENKPIDYMKLYRSLKHEYTHSVIHTLSNGTCPSWIDEGLAQWFEGVNIEDKRNLLATWLKYRTIIPLKRLHKSFVTLPAEKVQIAYAQSLFAIDDIINRYGIEKFNLYFQYVQVSYNFNRPFFKAFNISEKNYEFKLDYKIRKWAARK